MRWSGLCMYSVRCWSRLCVDVPTVPSLRGSLRAIHTHAESPSSTSAALRLIRSQPSQYIIASLAGRRYLLTPRDVLTVPRLRDVNVGDVLALTEVHEVGSREYTLRGSPCIPTSLVNVSATILEHTKGSMEFIFKKKRRKGYQKTIQHKQTYTRIRIGPIHLSSAGSDGMLDSQKYYSSSS